MMRRESISDSSKDDANVCDHTDDNQMNYETSSNRSLLCDFIGPLDGIAEHCDSEDDDNDVDALMMRLPSPVTVEPQQAFDLPPLRPTASLGFDDRRDDPSRNQGSASSGSAVCPDLRSRLISHDSWFLLFPNSTKNSNGNHFDRENAEESSTVERSRSSEKVPSVAKFAKDEEVNDTASDEASSTLSAEATPPGTTLRPPSMIPGRTRFATYDAIASPSRYQGRRRLSSYDASSLRHRLERVSSSRQGAGRPVWALRRGSLFHRNEARPSYMQTLVLKKQLREHFADLRQDANVPKTDSSIAKELLRQVESFDESASKLRESWQNQYPSSVEDDEGIEVITSRKDADVMASRKDADNFVVLDQNKRKRPSSSTPLEIRQQDYPPSPRDNDLHELVRQVLVEDHVKELSHKLKEIHALVRPYVREGISVESAFTAAPFPLQVRLKDMSYTVKLSKEFGKRNMVLETEGVRPGRAIHSICTFSTHMLSWIWKYLQRAAQCQPQVPRTRHGDLPRKNVLQSVNLIIEPGQNYLVLGPPGSGKSTLLKAIAGLLPLQDPFDMQGEITYNGKTIHDCAKEKIFIENAFGYIDQLDNHAPLLTVRETLEFAYQCKTGNRKKSSSVLKHRLQNQTPIDVDDEMESATSSGRIQQIDLDLSRKAKEDRLTLNVILAVLGLTEVQDTFVGNSTTIRGVSGGQKRRVTIGEMLMSQTPILCGDEISTGLDSETTYVMVETLLHFSRIMGYSRVFSLLQPSPEVVSLFDQIIVLGEGYILFAGKIEEVEEYFAHLGFRSPEFMDLADFLQLVSTDDRESLFEGDGLCPTVKELAYIFQHSSPQGADIQTLLNSPHDNKLDAHGSVQTRNGQSLQISAVQCKYANGFFRSLKLIAIRFLVLWVRDKQALSFSVVRNIINGSSVGGAFFNANDFLSISGALFQTGIFVLLGSLQTLAGLVTERSIFDKQSNANFFSAWPYVLGKNLSQVPQTFLLDSLLSGGLLYFMTGLGGRTNLANFATYVLILFVFACATNQQMAAFASFASESRLQVYAACFLFVSILFCGFLISPDVLPEYFLVFWYMNPFQWCYSAVILNEVYSGRWENPEAILEANGFVTLRNSVKSGHWIWWGVLFVVCYFVTCTVWTAVGLARSARQRIGGEAFVGAAPEDSWNGEDNSITGNETVAEAAQARFLFQPVTLSFKDLCYEVKASTTNDKLVLLKGISGIFHPGRMCALMGESGAGKTTLLDVISLRKHSGIRTGTVWINGFEQSEVPLRRCSGYVEQFDVQSPELTVLETILFSARLRLDPKIIRTEEMTKAFCKQVLEDVELNELAHCLVGNEDGAGLSFDQRKRLSIAVELAASPSVLFLDEPTSGLDARSALLIVRLLRKITTNQQRTIVATIHQPSSAVFELFDDLLLLLRGGRVAYHGPLGKDSIDVIDYFECEGAMPIELGDNPANWILRVIQDEDLGDLSQIYKESEVFKSILEQVDGLVRNANPNQEIVYDNRFATNFLYRQMHVNRRLRTIYWRSPTYNLGRLFVSLGLACFLGLVFIQDRKIPVYSESQARARVSTIFFSNVIVGILAQTSVQPIMTRIRDVFYQHRDAGMYNSFNLGFALGSAETFWIFASSALFCVVFISTSGLGYEVLRPLLYFSFFVFNSALFSYFGQMFVTLVTSPKAAMTLAGVFIGFNVLFSGLVIPPQQMVGTPYIATYYVTPGHYVLEGEVMALMNNDARSVKATPNSDYYDWLVETGVCNVEQQDLCLSSQKDYVQWLFGGEFSEDNIVRNLWILAAFLAFSRFSTWLSLKFIKTS